MPDADASTPRWGNQARDRKAQAIWHTLLQQCGPDIAERAWLDVGCGSGGIAAALADMARHVTGVDPEPWSTWADAMARHPNLTLLAGTFDRDHPPLADASVDIVVCNQVYEHVADPVALLRNIHRTLVAGGVCYFAGPNLFWPIEPHVFWPFVHWLPRRWAHALMRALGSQQADALDAYSAHCWRLRRWFRDGGFETRLCVRERIAATLHVHGNHTLARVVRRIPAALFTIAEPLLPGFIYVLRKPGGAGDVR
jgi:SAM-dependent methyltransferase